ncbi:MAG: GTP 3',8-cyclase MoaA [Candidatus Bathycorpusculaceae bacterium]
MVLIDSFGRPLLHLRIGITQSCNLHCVYCHREGEERRAESTAEEMSVDEIVRIARLAVEMGISKIKLTGGEPLMRKDIIEIVKGIALLPGLKDLSMATNGTLLGFLSKDLRRNGLRRVNINLPSPRPEVYSKLTGGKVEDVLDGLKAAVEAGFSPVKLNMVILKGVNENAIPEMIKLAREAGAVLQLIELDPVNVNSEFYSAHHQVLDEYEAALRQKAVNVKTRRFMHDRRIYSLPDLKVEVVHPIENTDFCMHCTRLRVTSGGKFKPCLMRNDNLVDILTPMRRGASDEELKVLFKIANKKREPYNKRT